MNIDELTWHLDIPFLWSQPDGYYDVLPRSVLEHPERYPEEYDRVQRADATYPIDVMRWHGRWVILDGLHRLMKQAMNSQREVAVRKISVDMIEKIQKLP